MSRGFENLSWKKERRNYGSSNYSFRYVTHDDWGETGQRKLAKAGIPMGETTVPYGNKEIAIDVDLGPRYMAILAEDEIDELLQ